jgi:hypothetical protein
MRQLDAYRMALHHHADAMWSNLMGDHAETVRIVKVSPEVNPA